MHTEVILFRQSMTNSRHDRNVHVLHRQQGPMLMSPPPCQRTLAEVLAERVTVSRARLLELDPGELVSRGYCEVCIGTLVG
jgi:hypothetical protein